MLPGGLVSPAIPYILAYNMGLRFVCAYQRIDFPMPHSNMAIFPVSPGILHVWRIYVGPCVVDRYRYTWSCRGRPNHCGMAKQSPDDFSKIPSIGTSCSGQRIYWFHDFCCSINFNLCGRQQGQSPEHTIYYGKTIGATFIKWGFLRLEIHQIKCITMVVFKGMPSSWIMMMVNIMRPVKLYKTVFWF